MPFAIHWEYLLILLFLLAVVAAVVALLVGAVVALVLMLGRGHPRQVPFGGFPPAAPQEDARADGLEHTQASPVTPKD